MSLTALAVVALIWVVVAVLVGLVLARVIRRRERQVPMAAGAKVGDCPAEPGWIRDSRR